MLTCNQKECPMNVNCRCTMFDWEDKPNNFGTGLCEKDIRQYLTEGIVVAI